MSKFSRSLFTAMFCVAFLFTASAANAAFNAKCRGQVAKNASKYAATVSKTMAGCHKNRNKAGSGDCSTLGAADTKGKAGKTADKFESAIGGDKSKCDESDTPAENLYDGCPAGAGPTDCSLIGTGPSNSFSNWSEVSACLICIIDDALVGNASNLMGSNHVMANPSASTLPYGGAKSGKCHDTIGKEYAKMIKTAVGQVIKCQSSAEKGGATTIDSGCSPADFGTDTKAGAGSVKARTKIIDTCQEEVGIAELRSCSTVNANGVGSCVRDAFELAGDQVGEWALTLDYEAPVATTTTTGGPTTTTTLGAQDASCPTFGQLTVLAGTSATTCANNGDCDDPYTCNDTIGKCQTKTILDSGTSGLGHRSGINDDVATRATLNCPGTICTGGSNPGDPCTKASECLDDGVCDGDSGATCGQCTITGIDTSTGYCRCANNPTIICDEALAADFDDCGGNTCQCFFGPPLPLSAGGTSVCVTNIFRDDIRGTANVDAGSGEAVAPLSAVVYGSITTAVPCPYCGGTCSVGGADCGSNAGCQFKCGASCVGGTSIGRQCNENGDCDGGGTCTGQTCLGGPANGTACTLDSECSAGTCSVGGAITPNDDINDGLCKGGDRNGLACDANAYSGDFPAPGGGWNSLDCPPDFGKKLTGTGLQINLNATTGSSSLTAGLTCSGAGGSAPKCHCSQCGPGGISCTSDSDCAGEAVTTCGGVGITATAQNGCLNPANCVADGGGANPRHICAVKILSFCDGLVTANGSGIISCSGDSGCTAVSKQAGLCTIASNVSCFDDIIDVQGTADPDFPLSVANFCVGKVGGAIDSAAGLPGPGRVVNQGVADAYCYGDENKIYDSGVGCPAP